MSFSVIANEGIAAKTKEQMAKEAEAAEKALKAEVINGLTGTVKTFLEGKGLTVRTSRVSNWQAGDVDVLHQVGGVYASLGIEFARRGWRHDTKKTMAKLEVAHKHVGNYPINKNGGFNVQKITARILEAVASAQANDKAQQEARKLSNAGKEALGRINATYGEGHFSEYSDEVRTGGASRVRKTDSGRLVVSVSGDEANAVKVLECLKAAGLL